MTEQSCKLDISKIKYDEKGLVPAVIQDEKTKTVLMVAYMNQESLEKTLAEGYTNFYSRSRQQFWKKGETSGHVQKVKEVLYDCDKDTLLFKVEQTGVACHEGRFSCFRPFDESEVLPDDKPEDILSGLYDIINSRKSDLKEGKFDLDKIAKKQSSYTAYLFQQGQDKILKKVGEESAETIIASKNNDKKELVYEMADLWYHCLVLLNYHDIEIEEIFTELNSRRK
ncbi:bifunctional phosphoribosyl-AMP cyclohydrolase/phosphoribosyl-ATP diphosphatase HisIE [Selenomonadales bacterium OttesenSCG-928-I06]|nr:bifunctional phosphoribosyl-AMP cyclohydrolase/phosphoribosyl-ATP diphosphatase HisIE [Selenomonadales bacterium OttesenSCG-928-I06]